MNQQKKTTMELNDDVLDDVIGGASLDEIRVKCTQLGIDFDALYADIRQMGTDLKRDDGVAELIILMAKNAWESSKMESYFDGSNDTVNALREKYPLDR